MALGVLAPHGTQLKRTFHAVILPHPTQTRNSGRVKQCWIARCGWMPRRGARGRPAGVFRDVMHILEA